MPLNDVIVRMTAAYSSHCDSIKRELREAKEYQKKLIHRNKDQEVEDSQDKREKEYEIDYFEKQSLRWETEMMTAWQLRKLNQITG